jgi:cyclohexanone monooxygenase
MFMDNSTAAQPDSPSSASPELAASRARYLQERDKRLRSDGNEQYLRMADGYASLQADPFMPVTPRAALSDTVEVLIIGGGFSGLITAARLKQAGIEEVRIIERAGDFGGTWYWNRYPGAQCDIESYIYLPLLEELGYVPQKKYSDAAEIFSHCRAIGRHFRLYDKACFHTMVETLHWDEAARCWQVKTDRGDRMAAAFICLADGPVSQPKLPGIAGIDSFRGKIFHSSRWDYAYTGGDAAGGMERLRDKRVGIIGTGATAIQCVPFLAESAGELLVFQRTPSSVFARNNQPTDASWAASLQAGWQQQRMREFEHVVHGGNAVPNDAGDGVVQLMRRLYGIEQAAAQQTPAQAALQMEQRDLQLMNELRARVDDIVADPVTAAALKPWYRLMCKRPCFNDAYLQAFNRPNVRLIDTDGKGVERLSGDSVIVGGHSHAVDCLILATGFEIGTAYPERSGFEVFGRDGLTLTDKWSTGMRTLHGLQTAGFPNCFFVGVTQGGYTANFSHMLCEQGTHIAYIVSEAKRRGMRVAEATAAGEDAWVDIINSFGAGDPTYRQECTPGYYNNEGRPEDASARVKTALFYGGGTARFFDLLKDWRTQGAMAGVTLRS